MANFKLADKLGYVSPFENPPFKKDWKEKWEKPDIGDILSIKYQSWETAADFYCINFIVFADKKLNNLPATIYLQKINSSSFPSNKMYTVNYFNFKIRGGWDIIEVKYPKNQYFDTYFSSQTSDYNAKVICNNFAAESDTFKVAPHNNTEDETSNTQYTLQGNYYRKTGVFIKKVGKKPHVYTSEGIRLNIDNETLLRMAGLAYGESGYSEAIIKAIPFCVINHHNILKSSGEKTYGENWGLNDTIIKMRNYWNDFTYAHEFHYGAQGNPAFRKFIGIALNEGIDFTKNMNGRNLDPLMLLSIEYTFKALEYQFNTNKKDYAEGGIGWQGVDIFNHSDWLDWLYIHKEDRIEGFVNWKNKHGDDLSKYTFQSAFTAKGSVGTTVIFKPGDKTLNQSTRGL